MGKRILVIGETGQVVNARAGYQVMPAYGFDNHPVIDVLIVPGGVHDGEMQKPAVIDWIARQAKQVRIVASVCTGTFLLAEARLLRNRNMTTHWGDIENLQTCYQDLTVHPSSRWIDKGSVVTSAGISAGIDMNLHLVGRLHGMELARKTAKQMEYDWTTDSLKCLS